MKKICQVIIFLFSSANLSGQIFNQFLLEKDTIVFHNGDSTFYTLSDSFFFFIDYPQDEGGICITSGGYFSKHNFDTITYFKSDKKEWMHYFSKVKLPNPFSDVNIKYLFVDLKGVYSKGNNFITIVRQKGFVGQSSDSEEILLNKIRFYSDSSKMKIQMDFTDSLLKNNSDMIYMPCDGIIRSVKRGIKDSKEIFDIVVCNGRTNFLITDLATTNYWKNDFIPQGQFIGEKTKYTKVILFGYRFW